MTDLFDGTEGTGPLIYNSAVSGANDWFTIANADDQYGTTVNIVYVLSASNGFDFNPSVLVDADANLAGELDQMDQAFDFTVDTILFDATVAATSPSLITLESYGDGNVNLVDTASGLSDLLDGVGDTVTDALDAVNALAGTTSALVDDVVDTTTDLVEVLLS